MKVAQVCGRYLPYLGGVETHVRELAERLAKRGLEIDVLTTDPSGTLEREETINNVKVMRFKSWAPSEAYYFSRDLRRYLLRSSGFYDIVHAHAYAGFPALYAARAKEKNKFVFSGHYHGAGHTFLRNLLHIPYRFLGKQTFEKADKIICVSEYEKHLVLKRFKIKEKKIVVIPNGINLDEIRRYRKRSKNGRVILYVGRLEKYKGVQYLIQVLPRLSDDIMLQIVGKGPYESNLLKLAAQSGLEDRVEFSHDLSRDQLLQKYADADVFALLSNHEAYGIVVAEALCSGVPCIVANESALREWVDGKNCFGITCPIDPQELSNLIKSTIGRKVEAPNLLDWDEVADRVLDVYKEVLTLGRN
jgi:glycosyltransferase involved in cell wall biosynthesis